MTCKLFLAVGTMAIIGFIGSSHTGHQIGQEADVTRESQQQFSWEFKELNNQRASTGRSYLQFQDNPTMHCGIYHLAAGSRDGQSPHSEDEVYFVESGAGKFHMDGQEFDVKPGTILFVPAMKTHYFHDITEDLSLLVFFSKAKPGD